jgi:hypothetical protein
MSWIFINGYYSWHLIIIRTQSFLKESLCSTTNLHAYSEIFATEPFF